MFLKDYIKDVFGAVRSLLKACDGPDIILPIIKKSLHSNILITVTR